MAEHNQQRVDDSMLDDPQDPYTPQNNEKPDDASNENDDSRLSTSSIIELDPKDLLIVKDGTVRVAMSVDRDQQKLDTNGEAVKATGTWTKAEHERFLRAMQTYPKGPWKSIAEMVATRTVRQTQTHAQKYREKMARRMRGLRNRNGTLQTPPQAMPDMPALAYPRILSMARSRLAHQQHQLQSQVRPASQPQILSHPITMGYSSAMVMSSSPVPSRGAQRPSTHQYQHQQQVRHYAHLPSQPQQPRYASTFVAAPVSPEFSQLSQSSISSAFLENATFPASWEANAAQWGEAVPDFDESMDFLMNITAVF